MCYGVASISEWVRGGTPPWGGCHGMPVEDVLFSEQIQVERKMFSFDLRENPRGRFLRVTEDVGGRRDTVIIPDSGLEQVRAVLDRAIEAARRAAAGAEGHGGA